MNHAPRPISLGRLTLVLVGVASLLTGVLAPIALSPTVLAGLASSIGASTHTMFLIAWLTMGALVIALLVAATIDRLPGVGRKDRRRADQRR